MKGIYVTVFQICIFFFVFFVFVFVYIYKNYQNIIKQSVNVYTTLLGDKKFLELKKYYDIFFPTFIVPQTVHVLPFTNFNHYINPCPPPN